MYALARAATLREMTSEPEAWGISLGKISNYIKENTFAIENGEKSI